MFWNVWNWEIGCLFSEFFEFLEFLNFWKFVELGDCVFNFGCFGMSGIGRLGV